MPEKKSRVSAILQANCPRCHQGDIFEYPFYRLDKFSRTHKYCPVCGLQYEREPGFFFGAMYISYVFTVAILLGTAFVLYFGFNDPPTWVYLSVTMVAIVLFLPVSFRFSRVLYLYAFGGVGYKPEYAAKQKNH